jgi:GrpB-like predicted nucleotidyltransferase (UPF0157 family)
VEENDVPLQRRIYLVPHDPAWAGSASAHMAPVAEILGPRLVEWHHIGSTSIPGIHAKPIIDLLPLVTSVAEVDPLQGEFEAAGYNWYGEYGLPGRRYVNRDDPETGDRVTNVHIYAVDDPDVARHLAFRDYLRAHPDEAAEYSRVKVACAAEHSTDINGYMDCKDATCKRIEAAALVWKRVKGEQARSRAGEQL